MDQASLLLMAKYNIWATQRLVRHLEVLTEQDFHLDVGLFFGSIAGTLNHLLLGEHYLWYPRFNNGISPQLSLDTIVDTNKQNILDELVSKSKNWIPYIQALTHIDLQGMLQYQRANGEVLCLPFAPTLMHVFNHATHHRGQITAAMTIFGYQCPELDLVFMLLEQRPKSN